jgi:phosphate/sulfate permease
MLARALCGWLSAGIAGAAIAHGGHEVPPGVAADAHLHLFDGVVVAPEWLLVPAIAAAVAVLAARRVRRRAAARARDRAARG